MTASEVKQLARDHGFELAGIASAVPSADAIHYMDWVRRGLAGEMRYLTDHRADKRADPRSLLPSAKSILCVGKLYNHPRPYSAVRTESELAWISRYAWGGDYHHAIREGLERLTTAMLAVEPFDYRICVDTAPLLERSYARAAGLGWLGKNTCLINQGMGSWFFLGEALLSLDLEPGAAATDRCGSCTRCIDACPTQAIVETSGGVGPSHEIDARLCISYLTIELRGEIPEDLRARLGHNIFGCDICQDVCPWNRRAATTSDAWSAPRHESPPLVALAAISPDEFRAMFRGTPVWRSKYAGFLRNVASAMGSIGAPEFRDPLLKLAASEDAIVAQHARWGLARLQLS